MSIAKYIMIETFIILDDVVNFVPKWNKQIKEKIIWPNYLKKVQMVITQQEDQVDHHL